MDSAAEAPENNRVLVIDDNRAIHDDFRKILTNPGTSRTQLDAAAASLFGVPAKPKRTANFHLESAFQGKDGARMAETALGEGRPYAMAFVDMRMPPGWDGLETIARLWQTQPDLQIVLCTAHSDYSLDEIQEKIDVADRLLILKKPFDTVEVMQLTQALTEKWRLSHLARAHTAELTRVVDERTAELRKSAKFLGEQARLLDLATDAILVLDLENKVQFWNAGARQLYGWPPESVLGEPVVGLLFPVRSDFAEARASLLAHGEWHGEMNHRTSSGAQVTVSSRWTLVLDEAGRPKSILVISSDITDQKLLEQQLLRAQRMESIGTLASGVAHDLNNILAPILMCAPLLREEMALDQKTSLISVIEKSAARGAQIVKQVLAFGRGLEGDHQPIELRSLIKEMVQITSETFPKNVRIDAEIAPDLCKILGDQTQWHQVFLNLSVNARDAMPDGGTLHFMAANLEVDEHYATMQPALRPGPHVIVEVSDNGSGMPPEVVDRIFDPFFTTKAVGQGTGLGLSTVLGIVKSHHGIIEVSSIPGRGTTFRIVLPATAATVFPEGKQRRTKHARMARVNSS